MSRRRDGLAPRLLGLALAIHLGGVDERHTELDTEAQRGDLLAPAPAVAGHLPGALSKRRALLATRQLHAPFGFILARAVPPFVGIPAGRSDWRYLLSLDWLSLVLMAATLATLEIGLKEAPKRGWTSVVVVGLLALTAAAGAAFARRTLRAAHPVVELWTLRDRKSVV